MILPCLFATLFRLPFIGARLTLAPHTWSPAFLSFICGRSLNPHSLPCLFATLFRLPFIGMRLTLPSTFNRFAPHSNLCRYPPLTSRSPSNNTSDTRRLPDLSSMMGHPRLSCDASGAGHTRSSRHCTDWVLIISPAVLLIIQISRLPINGGGLEMCQDAAPFAFVLLYAKGC